MPTMRKFRAPTTKRPGYTPVARVGVGYRMGMGPAGGNPNQFAVRCAACGTVSLHLVRRWAFRQDGLQHCPQCGQPFLYVKTPWRALPWIDPAAFRLEDYQELPDLPEEPVPLTIDARDSAERQLTAQNEQIEALVEMTCGLEQRVAALEQYIQAEHELTRYLIQRNATTYTRAHQRLNGTAPGIVSEQEQSRD